MHGGIYKRHFGDLKYWRLLFTHAARDMTCNGARFHSDPPAPERRVPPHVSFIIDLDLVKGRRCSLEETKARVLGLLLKILLFFHSYVDRQVIWSYQMFEVHAASALDTDGDFTQSGEQFSANALHRFKCRLDKAFSACEQGIGVQSDPAHSNRSDFSRISKVGLVLRNSMSSFRWTWSWCPGARTSPIRSAIVSSRIENYLFIISNFPRDEQGIMEYFRIKDKPGDDRLDFLIAEAFRKDIVHRDMWEWFKDQRISVNWLDDLCDIYSHYPPPSSTLLPILSSLLSIYGGRIIPVKLILDHCCPLHFFKLFSRTLERYTNYNVIFDRFFGRFASSTPLQMMATITDIGKFYYTYEVGQIERSRQSKVQEWKLSFPPELLNVRLSLFNINYKNYQTYFYVSKNMASQFAGATKRKKLKIEPLGYCSSTTLIEKQALEDGILLCVPEFHSIKSSQQGLLALNSLKIYMEKQRKSMAVRIEIFKNMGDFEDGPNTRKKLEIKYRLAVMSPFLVGTSMLQFVDDGKAEEFIECLTCPSNLPVTGMFKESGNFEIAKNQNNIDSQPHDTYSLSSNEYLKMWFSSKIPENVHDYVFSDYLPQDNFNYFEEATLRVLSYGYKKANCIPVVTKEPPNNYVHTANSPTDLPSSKKSKQKDKEGDLDVYANINTFEALFLTFHTAYIDIVYDTTKPILEFLECLLPSLYSVLEKLSDKQNIQLESRTAVGQLFDYITNCIVYSVSQLERKYQEIPKTFESILYASGESDIDLGSIVIRKLEIHRLKSWIYSALSEIDMPRTSPISKTRLNPKAVVSKIREKIRELRIQEAKLQMVILLECIRLSVETSTPLPELPSKPSRLSELMRPDALSLYGQVNFCNIAGISLQDSTNNLPIRKTYLRALEELADRLCIWYSVAGIDLDSGGNKLLKNFIEPIIEEFYQFSLTEIVKLLHLKAGGDAFKEDKNKDPSLCHLFIEGGRSKTKHALKCEKHKINVAVGKSAPSSLLQLQKSKPFKGMDIMAKSLEHLNRRQVIMHKKTPRRKIVANTKDIAPDIMPSTKNVILQKINEVNTGIELPGTTTSVMMKNGDSGNAQKVWAPQNNRSLPENKGTTLANGHPKYCSPTKWHNATTEELRAPPTSLSDHDLRPSRGSTKVCPPRNSDIHIAIPNYQSQQIKSRTPVTLPSTHTVAPAKPSPAIIQIKSATANVLLKSHLTTAVERDQTLSVKNIKVMAIDIPQDATIHGNVTPKFDNDTPHSHVTISATPGSQRRLHGLLQGFAEDLDYWEDLEFN